MTKCCALIGLLILTHPLWAQQTYSLPDLARSALERNADLVITQKQSTLQDLSIAREASALKPQINFSSRYFHYWDDVPTYAFPSENVPPGTFGDIVAVPLGLRNNFLLDLTLRQRLFDFQMLGAKSRLQGVRNLQEAELVKAQGNVLLQLSESYFQLKQLDAQRQSIDFNRRRLEKLLDITRVRVENDLALGLDSIRLRKLLNGLLLEERRLKKGRELAESNLLRLAGIDENVAISTAYEFSFVLEPSTGTSANEQLLNEAQQLQEQRLEREKTLAPTLDLLASFALQGQGQSLGFNDEGLTNNLSIVGLQLDLPIWNGNAASLRKQEIKSQLDLLSLQRAKLQSGEALQRQQLEDQINYLESKIALEEEWLVALESAYMQAEAKWQEGLLGINDLLEVDAEKVEVEQQLANFRYELTVARLQYLQVTGQLTTKLLSDEN